MTPTATSPLADRGAARSVRHPASHMSTATGAALLIAGIGGYGFGWRWTGFADKATLWDLLHLLLLPVLLPLRYASRRRLAGPWQVVLAAAAAGFAVAVVGGYRLDWAWTGFAGNTLWDWLELLLVPFALPVAVTIFSRHTTIEESS